MGQTCPPELGGLVALFPGEMCVTQGYPMLHFPVCFVFLFTPQLLRAYFVLDTELDVEDPRLMM